MKGVAFLPLLKKLDSSLNYLLLFEGLSLPRLPKLVLAENSIELIQNGVWGVP